MYSLLRYKVLLDQHIRELRREERLREREAVRREARERRAGEEEGRKEAEDTADGAVVTKTPSREDVARDEGIYSRDSEGFVNELLIHFFECFYIQTVYILCTGNNCVNKDIFFSHNVVMNDKCISHLQILIAALIKSLF